MIRKKMTNQTSLDLNESRNSYRSSWLASLLLFLPSIAIYLFQKRQLMDIFDTLWRFQHQFELRNEDITIPNS